MKITCNLDYKFKLGIVFFLSFLCNSTFSENNEKGNGVVYLTSSILKNDKVIKDTLFVYQEKEMSTKTFMQANGL